MHPFNAAAFPRPRRGIPEQWRVFLPARFGGQPQRSPKVPDQAQPARSLSARAVHHRGSDNSNGYKSDSMAALKAPWKFWTIRELLARLPARWKPAFERIISWLLRVSAWGLGKRKQLF